MLSLARDRSRTADAAFVPARLPGCALWLRADLGITLNGSTVSAWANQGTLGGSVTQGTASAQPTYSAAGGPNSQPTLTLDGGDYLTSTLAASNWAFLHGNNSTVFVVFRSTTNSTTHFGGLVSTYDGTVTNRGAIVGWDNRSGISRDDALAYSASNGTAYTYSTASANGTSAFNTWQIVEVAHDYNVAGNDLVALISGTSVLGTEPLAVPSASAPTNTLHIGALGGGIVPMIGGLPEVIAYNRTLSAAERFRLRRYLSNRYAITVA